MNNIKKCTHSKTNNIYAQILKKKKYELLRRKANFNENIIFKVIKRIKHFIISQ